MIDFVKGSGDGTHLFHQRWGLHTVQFAPYTALTGTFEFYYAIHESQSYKVMTELIPLLFCRHRRIGRTIVVEQTFLV
jgi:hypothetical protein